MQDAVTYIWKLQFLKLKDLKGLPFNVPEVGVVECHWVLRVSGSQEVPPRAVMLPSVRLAMCILMIRHLHSTPYTYALELAWFSWLLAEEGRELSLSAALEPVNGCKSSAL